MRQFNALLRRPMYVAAVLAVLFIGLSGVLFVSGDGGSSTSASSVQSMPPVPVDGSPEPQPLPPYPDAPSPDSHASPLAIVLYVVMVLLLLALVAAAIRAVRTPPGFVRLAEGMVTGALGIYLAGIAIMLVVLAVGGSKGTQLSFGNVDFGRGQVSVRGTLNTSFSNGTGDDDYERRMARRSFGPHAVITDDGRQGFHAELRDPPAKIWLLAILSALWHVATIGLCLYALRTVLASTLRGDPFGERPVRWMRWLAFGLLLAGPGTAIVSHLTTSGIVHANGGNAYGLEWGIPGTMILGAILVFALSEVWRYGFVLQREVEATI
jgi:Protein of unknown function (DUF2975)